MEASRSERLERVIGEIRKRWGEEALRPLGLVSGTATYIQTGITELDKLLGGGIPSAQISELIGAPSCGLTALVLSIIAKAQARKRITVYLDLGHAFDPGYAVGLGIQLENLLLARPEDVDSALDILQVVAGSAGPALIVLDSTVDIQKQALGQGKLVLALAKVALLVKHSGASVIVISPTAKRVATAPSIGLRLKLRRRQWLVENGDIAGCQTAISILKRRRGQADQSIEVCFRLEDAEDMAWKRVA